MRNLALAAIAALVGQHFEAIVCAEAEYLSDELERRPQQLEAFRDTRWYMSWETSISLLAYAYRSGVIHRCLMAIDNATDRSAWLQEIFRQKKAACHRTPPEQNPFYRMKQNFFCYRLSVTSC